MSWGPHKGQLHQAHNTMSPASWEGNFKRGFQFSIFMDDK